MSIFKRIFSRKKPVPAPPFPTWEEIVEQMQGQDLAYASDRLVRLIPSRDKTKRIVILQSQYGYFKASLEELHAFDDDEWKYICRDCGKCPAWWQPISGSIYDCSFYGTEDELMKAVAASIEYKTYFV